MFELFYFMLAAFDGVVAGVIVALLIGLMFGDDPGARIAKILLGIAAGVGYFIWCLSILVSEDVSLTFGNVVFFAPVVVFFVLKLLVYAFKKE